MERGGAWRGPFRGWPLATRAPHDLPDFRTLGDGPYPPILLEAMERAGGLFVAEMLVPHLESVPAGPDALVFKSSRRGTHTAAQFDLPAPCLAACSRSARLPATVPLHDCRHSCTSFAIRQGTSVKAVQQELGHSRPTVTLNACGQLFADDLDRLYEALEALGTSDGLQTAGSASESRKRRGSGSEPALELRKYSCAPGGTRTPDPRIRSPNPYLALTCADGHLGCSDAAFGTPALSVVVRKSL